MAQPRVLIVDDDKTMREFVAMTLEGDCIVEEAPDATSALGAVTTTRPDLILLDVTLPGDNGLDLLRELRRRSEAPPVVVMLTASSDEGTEWQARDLGAVAFVAKPVDANDLRALVVRHLP